MKRYADLMGNHKKYRIKSRYGNKCDIAGLKDPGGALSFTANLTSAFKTAWETLVSAYETAATSSKATWFEISVPTVGSFYFAGIPAELGINGMSVDAVAETSVYITPNQIHGWDTSST